MGKREIKDVGEDSREFLAACPEYFAWYPIWAGSLHRIYCFLSVPHLMLLESEGWFVSGQGRRGEGAAGLKVSKEAV